MNDATPFSAVKAGKGIPLSKLRERSFEYARRNSAGDRNFPFHHTDRSVSEYGDFKSEFESESPGAESKTEDGTISHILPAGVPWTFL
jgi:hypothetical protein